jgi:hypothetical protein
VCEFDNLHVIAKHEFLGIWGEVDLLVHPARLSPASPNVHGQDPVQDKPFSPQWGKGLVLSVDLAFFREAMPVFCLVRHFGIGILL